MIKKIILLLSFCVICYSVGCSNVKKGPIFIQTHFTNAISSISLKDIKQILNGTITNFNSIGGKNVPITIYIDKKIFSAIKNYFPKIKATPYDFSFNTIVSKRSFLGISDINGLRPYF